VSKSTNLWLINVIAGKNSSTFLITCKTSLILVRRYLEETPAVSGYMGTSREVFKLAFSASSISGDTNPSLPARDCIFPLNLYFFNGVRACLM